MQSTPEWDELLGAVHVWHVSPNALPADELARRCFGWLSPAERERHARFRTEPLRHAYLATRALCRATLSHYAGVPPAAWEFVANRFGKPAIATPAEFAGLRFNLTHTTGLLACAVTRAGEIGLDIEETTRSIDVAQVARHFLSADERAALAALPPDRQRERFFDYWVVKEAYLKGIGTGLSQPGDGFTITWENDRSALPLGDWHFSLTRPDEDHVAALAHKMPGGAAPRVSWRPWGL